MKAAYLLSIEHIVTPPELANAEALVQTAILVGLSEEPRCAHEVLPDEVLGNLPIPSYNVGFPIVNDRTQLSVAAEVCHELFHPLDGLRQVNDALLVGLVIEGADSILDSFAKDGWQARLHSSMGERELMVTAIRRPWWVVGVDLAWLSASFDMKGEDERTAPGERGHGALMSVLSGR